MHSSAIVNLFQNALRERIAQLLCFLFIILGVH